MNHADVTRLFGYTEWANHLVLDSSESMTVEQLTHDFGTGQHSIFETLVHMLGAEWVWLERWLGGERLSIPGLVRPFKSPGPDAFSVVRQGWNQIEEIRTGYLTGLSEASLQAPLSYANLRGEPFAEPLIEQMLHVVNHSTQHRGQVVGFLRALGVTPPTTDMIHYFRTVA